MIDTNIPQTHKSVENEVFPFNIAQVGDIVIAFEKYHGVIIQDFGTDEDPEAPMEVARIDNNQTMMVFRHEMKIIAKPRFRVMEIEVNWQEAKKTAVQAAMKFDEFDW